MGSERLQALSGIVCLVGLLGIPTIAASAPQERIRGPIDTDKRVVLKGNIHSGLRSAIDTGSVEPWMKVNYMRLVLKPSGEQAIRLEEFLAQQRDPSSPDYQHWLTPEEFGDRFGVSDNDLAKIMSWLQAEGLTVEQVARAKNWIAFSGTASIISTAFRTTLHRYSVDSETHYANIVEPSIPTAIAGVVDSIRELDDFRPKPPASKQRLKRFQPDFTSSTGAHYLAPDDLATIYDIAALYRAGFNGAGQKLVIAGQTDIKISDIRSFRSQFGLPPIDPQLVLYGPDPGVSSGDQVEANLDLEWSGAVARNATIVYVYSQNVFESLQYAIDQNLGTVMSVSYGGCEIGNPSSFRAVAQQANAQGITWMNASGDSGAAGCDAQGESAATQGPAVTFPANIPEVTGVGGTEFVETGNTGWSTNSTTLGSATGYIPEKAWNDTPLGQGIEGGTGGSSTVFSKPWWQTGLGVPNDNARDVPDVAMAASAAHDGYLIYAQGGFWVVGGTSASTPSFAGIIALLNQYVVAKGIQPKAGLGNINPTLYSLAQSTAGVFHDITNGDNIVPCKSGSKGCPSAGSFGYKAGPGYDMATGLGSVDAYNLVTKWSTAPVGVGTTTTLTTASATIAQSATTQLTAKVSPVSGTAVPTGAVAFMLGSQSLGSVALTPPTAGTGASASLTVKGTGLAVGSNTITAAYSSTGNFAASSGSTTVTVTAPPVGTTTSVAANPASILSTATAQLTATVKAASGSTAPGGAVTFSLAGVPLGTATLSPSGATSTTTLTVRGSSLAIGNNSITASYVASGNFSNSSGTISVMVTVPPVATTTSLAANPASIASTASTVLTATVKASGTATPTGSVTFSLGNTALGSSTLSASGAALTVKASSLAIGANTITASYTPTGNFLGSGSSTAMTVIAPLVTTTLLVTANPSSIASTASTLLTATVKTSGTSAPTGSVTFSLGNTILGNAPLSASSASLTLKGSSLAIGTNNITASYTATGNFSNSSASTTVTVTAPPVATSTSVAANPSTIATSAATVVTATVKAASGSALPTGTVIFSTGNTTLGSVPLSASGATLAVKGSTFTTGSKTVTATYSGASTFLGSSGSTTVTVTH